MYFFTFNLLRRNGEYLFKKSRLGDDAQHGIILFKPLVYDEERGECFFFRYALRVQFL